jgi:hypothetical protein
MVLIRSVYGIALNREEKDMEYKLKENVKVNSLTFKKQVLEEAIDLMGVITNYTQSNLDFNLMLAFLDNMIEGNTLLEELAKSTRLINELESNIEPLFKQVILDNELHLAVFNELSAELVDYANREVINNHNITGLLYNIIDGLGELNQNDVMVMLDQVVTWAANKFVPIAKEKTQKTKTINNINTKEEENIEVQDQKMLDLIEKFKNQGNIAK